MPDLLCLKSGVYMWLEVKAPEGRLSNRQKWIHEVLRGYGATVYVVRSLEDLGEILCTVNSNTSTPSDSIQTQESALSSAPSSTEA